jgi:hypothetical protein
LIVRLMMKMFALLGMKTGKFPVTGLAFPASYVAL